MRIDIRGIGKVLEVRMTCLESLLYFRWKGGMVITKEVEKVEKRCYEGIRRGYQNDNVRLYLIEVAGWSMAKRSRRDENRK